jgi:hypothetical protein
MTNNNLYTNFHKKKIISVLKAINIKLFYYIAINDQETNDMHPYELHHIKSKYFFLMENKIRHLFVTFCSCLVFHPSQLIGLKVYFYL